MTVKVDDVVGISGFVMPGSHVDIVAVITPQSQQGYNQDPVSKIVLQNIKVLATGPKIDSPENEREPNSVKAVTLQVTPEEAEKLALAANQFDDALKHYTAAREALIRDNALARRLAQCDFGLGATAYFRHEDAEATSRLKLVTGYEDPSIDAAYLFAAELDRGKDPDKALSTAQQAVAYNPDSVDGWKMVGTIAAQLPRQRRLLDEAINRVGDLAPGSEALHQLQKLR